MFKGAVQVISSIVFLLNSLPLQCGGKSIFLSDFQFFHLTGSCCINAIKQKADSTTRNPIAIKPCQFTNLFWILSLFSSRKASHAIHLAGFESICLRSVATSIASAFMLRLLLPICRKAQLTDFLTKFLSSVASLLMIGKNCLK